MMNVLPLKALEREAITGRAYATSPRIDGNDSVANINMDDDVHSNYEAIAIAHSQALAASVEDIHSIVPLALDPISSQYNRWNGLFPLTLKRYARAASLMSHTPTS